MVSLAEVPKSGYQICMSTTLVKTSSKKPAAAPQAGAIAWAVKLRGVTNKTVMGSGDAELLKMGLLIRTSASIDRVARAVLRRFETSRDDHDLKIAYARLHLDLQHAQVEIANRIPSSSEMKSVPPSNPASQDGRVNLLPVGVQINNYPTSHGTTTTVTSIPAEPTPVDATVLPEAR